MRGKKIIMAMLVGMLLIVSISSVSATGWLDGYDYRKQIDITGQAGAGTGYQILFSVGDTSGGDFDTEGHCTNFPYDITWTASDEVTEHPKWIENSTDPAQIWVNVSANLNTSQDIYVYYGGEDKADDGDSVFEFFDDFDIDISKWAGDTAYASIASGILSLTNSPDHKIYTASQYSGDIAMRTRANLVYHGGSMVGFSLSDTSHFALLFTYPDSPYNFFQSNDGSVITISNADLGGGAYHIYDVCRILTGTDTIRGYMDGVQLGSGSTSHVPTDTFRGLVRMSSAGTTYVDWFLIRKYIYPEPAFASAGAEERNPELAGSCFIINPYTHEGIPYVCVCIPSLQKCEYTDSFGSYDFSDLEDGTYTVKACTAQFQCVEQAITVSDGIIYGCNITLTHQREMANESDHVDLLDESAFQMIMHSLGVPFWSGKYGVYNESEHPWTWGEEECDNMSGYPSYVFNFSMFTYAISMPFTLIMGNLFFVLLFSLPFLMLWLRQESMNIPVVVGIILGAGIFLFLPAEYELAAKGILAVALTGGLFLVLKDRS
jgi:hypothetical protein